MERGSSEQPQAGVVTDSGANSPEGEEFNRFRTYIGSSALPGDREALLGSAHDLLAPDDIMEALKGLPAGTTYHDVTEIWRALGK